MLKQVPRPKQDLLQRLFLGLSALLLAAHLFTSQKLNAEEVSFPAVPPGFRIGMEMELSQVPLSNLMGYFDFDKLQKKYGSRIPPSEYGRYYDDYLLGYPQALNEMPENLREQLTHGLQLEDTVLKGNAPSAHQLLGPDGQPIHSEPNLVVPDKSISKNPGHAFGKPADEPKELVLPSAPLRRESEAFQKQGELIVPKTQSWQTLYQRWRELSPDIKASVVRWENLPARTKAEFAIYDADGDIKLKDQLGPQEKQLFDRLEWVTDGDALEFRHRDDVIVRDPQEFYRDVTFLAKRAGVESKILNPGESRLQSASFHYHISVHGKDLVEQGFALNQLAFVRRVNAGILSDLTGEGDYLYHPDATKNRLVRVYDRDRIEFKNHLLPLREELAFSIRAVTLEKAQALHLIDSEIKRLMTPYVVGKIIQYKPQYLEDLIKHVPELVPELKKNPDPKVRRAVERGLARGSSPSLSPSKASCVTRQLSRKLSLSTLRW